MRRATQGEVPDGIYLVRVDRVQYGRKAQQPFFLLHLAVLEPKAFAGRRLMSRLYCTQKAMRKLGWFLRDFLYDPELLRGERNRRACPARPDRREDEPHVVNDIALVNLTVRASEWEELSTVLTSLAARECT